ncbi:DNA-binding protein [Clavibacter michiganensis]|uniref:DNA-binding protein n=1 Tax=Clavibacter michiganensis TaxID=28447 RepID=UPI000CE752F5|nr:DNA-binding protein [Clavibacter michiganensis]PPF87323.1 DNA-binding protein [Clavibacter michiganensis]PPF94778.1 DNA-binding protein [Clavibacter michiganensis]
MFVITADQKASRNDIDRAGTGRDDLATRYEGRLVLPVDRTAGDEVQALVADAATALDMVLVLTRAGHWSVGLGIGAVRTPLPRATREATGPAFIAARDAVTAAKRSVTRFALATDPPTALPGDDPAAQLPGAAEVEALLTLLLLARDRRTPQGWDVVDRMAGGGTQREVAAELGITPQAVSTRLRTSGWRAERAAIPGLEALLAHLDAGAAAAGEPGTARDGHRS